MAEDPSVDGGLYKSIVWVHALVGALARRGIDSGELFRESHVDPSLLGDARARITLIEWRALVKRAIVVTQDPGLGLTIASTAPDNIHQIVGQIASACGSMREAMRMFERYRPLLGNTNRFEMIEEGERAYFVFAPFYPDPEAAHFAAELALGIVYLLSRRHARHESDDAQEVWFSHPAPAHAGRYAEVFRCPVRFERPRNAIVFHRQYLDAPLLYANPILLDVLREGAERMLEQQGTPSLPERVRTMLRHEVDLCRVDAERIARLLKLDTRSFRRQLIDAGAPWSVLIDEARCRIACEELGRGDMPIRQLSERLGFSDQSAFNRAFKRWTGTTPVKFSQTGASTPPASFSLGRIQRRSELSPSHAEAAALEGPGRPPVARAARR
jgi:AraC-like DNA-binding protein